MNEIKDCKIIVHCRLRILPWQGHWQFHSFPGEAMVLGIGQWIFVTEKEIDEDINSLRRATQRVGRF